MSKEIYISSTPHETRLAIVEHDELTEIYYERENEYTLAGSIYNGKVTRVLPGMQSSFVDVGLERDAFLYITDFMEEAGDSADFDTSENRGRSNGRRNDRGRESQLGTNVAAEVQGRSFSETDAFSPASEPRQDGQVEDRSPERTTRGDQKDRGERNDRSRRRGRGGNRDLTAHETAPVVENVASEERSSLPTETIQLSAPEPGNEAEVGEGAPGADGSRRWRGRRGRRRGRSGSRDNPAVGELRPSSMDADAASVGPDPSAGYDLAEPDEEIEIEASAPPSQTIVDPTATEPSSRSYNVWAPAPASETSSPGTSVNQSEGRNSGPREKSERGRHDRSGRGRERREDRPRAPRGFTPSRSLYGVEEASSFDHGNDAPAIEPVILPGESLSKYRQGGESSQTLSSAPVAPAPVPEFNLPGVWDGGNVLPGETLRPRTPTSSAGSEPRRDRGRDSGHEGRLEGRRNDRFSPQREPAASLKAAPAAAFHNGPAPARPDTDGAVIEAPPEAKVTQAEVTPALSTPEVEEVPLKETGHSAATTTAGATQTEQEYEPTEGSASYRFDPLPPREFRQPAAETELLAAEPSSAHSITPPAGTPLAPLQMERDPASSPAVVEQISETPLAHDLTSITSDGEMLSQAPEPPPTQEIAEPTSPIQHESVILHAEADSPKDVELGAASEAIATAHPIDAPEISSEADDLIVQELSREPDSSSEGEEEDFATTTLHAASIEEMDYDDDEEETLEGAADLGTMLREMSIDQITQPAEPAIEDDDYAFEEEDSVEDSALQDSFQEASVADPMGFTEADFSTDRASADSDAFDAPRSLGEAEGPANDQHCNDRRRGGRRDGRRGSRDRDRGGDRSRSSSSLPTGSISSDRGAGSRPGRRDGHRSAQTTNLPAISDLLKPGQEVLVQIAKEPIAKKGARITSHIALPGRFLVFMPTVNHTGVSRKIESDGERRRLKEVLLSEKGEASGGFIVRTAAAGATEEELRSDLRFLLNLWADIKQRSESSKSPALIYHDLNLVERVLRDQVTDNFSAIWVDTESEYERVLRFLQRFQPSLIRRVKLYTKETPLFEQFGITEEINKALRSKVWLKSGGSIVINQTEALVAIDINTGKYVGKTARLEDTIVKTNLDAIPEIVRQIRLRDLGGIIIIDFIDMDERKNRHKVMAVLEEELKKDRAPSKVLQFNDFGLVAITRKRVKQSLERTLSTTCGICAGTGMVKSAVTVCNDIYIEMRKMQKHLDRGDVMLRVNPEVVKQLKSPTAKWLQEMEEMVGKTILIKSDPTLHPEQFDIH